MNESSLLLLHYNLVLSVVEHLTFIQELMYLIFWASIFLR